MNSFSRETKLLHESLKVLEEGYSHLPKTEESNDPVNMSRILRDVAERLHDNYPYFHPYYLGQMLKPPHHVARLAYQLALHINPNNHALDGGIASSAMEKEAVKGIAEMFEITHYLGHLTSGGTMANLEALWIANLEHPGKAIAASDQAHYTHQRISGVLGLEFREIPSDSIGRMDIQALDKMLGDGTIGTVVVTLGTTGFGAIDPLFEVLQLRKHYDFRIHVDAAYGGYFMLDESLDESIRRHFSSIQFTDSVVIDPHKHGLQPYGCGCVLFSDPLVGRHYQHESPYTYFSSDELHLGEISLECSRAGASAVALYATMQAFPLKPGGELGQRLARSRQAAQRLVSLVHADCRFLTAWVPDLDIAVWMPKGAKASEVSQLSQALLQSCATQEIHLALFQVPKAMVSIRAPKLEWDIDHVTCLRACLMKPEHLNYLDEIWQRISAAMDCVSK
ncbi:MULTISPECIES: pyridoxal phosphate-dependent decarboxylase family protein [unclassified Halomonas]|uniref:pyridoxal phosphate-dependent decarboxylase family protein n=1 Tax=unclassified Halomonas TaxID=2609666 RepID=UPI0007F1500F|nr:MULTISPECIES: aminotransferase class V-fold PLP-dependent enzyme [unclassified Halomonas]SBR45816.1 Glutamate or tyrosine decarboxylase [Halomonas sp. HL-93]SNY98462.1 Glutamate or tyrosine decarboxylase [Halomonas sp. hl-4]